MSHFITASNDISDRFKAADNALYNSPYALIPRPEHIIEIWTEYDDSYLTAWPTSRVMGGFSPMSLAGIMPAFDYDPFLRASDWTGGGGFVTISGITRDTNSVVLGSVTVQLFRTLDDLLMDQRTSDPNSGEYSVYTPDTGNHYIVAYKAGSPDVAGTTVNTLVGV